MTFDRYRNESPRRVPWYTWIVAVDLILIAATIFQFHAPSIGDSPLFSGGRGWRVLQPFNLSVENNPAAWWSGISLLAAGLLAYELFARRQGRTALGWLCLSIVLVGFSFDEMASIHERMGGFRGMLPYALVAAVVLGLGLLALVSRPETRGAALLIGFGFLCLASVALQEYLEHHVSWPGWARGLRSGVEEGTELLGIFLILRALVAQRQQTGEHSLRAVVPKPSSMPWLPTLIFLGAALNTGICLLVAPHLPDLDVRGNPAGWYPAAVYFVLFCLAFWKALDNRESDRRRWAALSVLFLVCSVDVLSTFARYLPIVFPGLQATRLEPLLTGFSNLGHLLLVLVIAWIAIGKGVRRSLGSVVVVVAVVSLALVGLATEEFAMALAAPGLVSYGLAWLFLVLPEWAEIAAPEFQSPGPRPA